MVATQKDPRGHTHSPILGIGCPRHRGAVGGSGIVILSAWSWTRFAVVLASFKCKTRGRRIPCACKSHPGTNLQQSQVGSEGLPPHPWIGVEQEEMEPRGSPGPAWGMGRHKHCPRTTSAVSFLAFCAHLRAGRAVFPGSRALEKLRALDMWGMSSAGDLGLGMGDPELDGGMDTGMDGRTDVFLPQT